MTTNRKSSLRAALFLPVALLLGACQSLAPLDSHMPAAQQVPDVPFFPQEEYQCGPAALATVLGSAGSRVDDQALVDEVWLPARRGSLAMELVAAARARERLVYPVNTPEALLQQLDAGLPVLVMQNLAFSFYPRWHFAVVTGYRDRGATVLLNTDTREAEPENWNRFVRTWARADYQGWVVTPPGTLPAGARPVALVRALEELAGTAGASATTAYWDAAGERFPNDYLVQFALGNHLWAVGRPQHAIHAWRAATRARPSEFAAWHNLALALAGQGCATDIALAGARQSAHSAERLQQLEQAVADTPARESCL